MINAMSFWASLPAAAVDPIFCSRLIASVVKRCGMDDGRAFVVVWMVESLGSVFFGIQAAYL
jgi:hypothetical protein